MKRNTYTRSILMRSITLVLLLTGATVMAQDIVNIPDANFKSALLANASINTNGDTEIQVAEASAYTGTVNVSNKGIADLTGIERFTAITGLYCANNQLAVLNVSANTLLTQLRCNHNQLTSLDVSANTALVSLDCYSNVLSTLDVSANGALVSLKCFNNYLTSLELGETGSMTDLRANHNQLASLDLGNNNFKTLYVYNNGLTELDLTGSTQLTDLRCNVNKLVTLDLSENPLLTNLNCSNNKLISLALAAGPVLKTIAARNNFLAVVDLSGNAGLTAIDFRNNDLIYFNIQNGQNTQLIGFNTTLNPELQCIQVDDPAYSTTEWTQVDATSEFDTSCPTENSDIVYIPDANFRNQLIKFHDIDLNDDKQIQVAEAAAYTGVITARNASITDLTGIEAFPSATALDVTSNLLQTVDLSANVSLEYINVFDNQLTALHLSANTLLERVYAGRNSLLTFDATDLTALRILDVGENQLTTLDLSTNTQLTSLNVSRNQFSSLSVTENTALITLLAENNQLTSLDLSQNTALDIVSLRFNHLHSLDVSQNTQLDELYVSDNRLTYLKMPDGNNWSWLRTTNNPDLFCIQVTDVAYAEGNPNVFIDAWTDFQTFCAPEPIVFIPDPQFKNALIARGVDTSGDGEIQVSEAEAVELLSIFDENISDFTGIEAFANLVTLYAGDNNVSAIDLSSNASLFQADLSNNSIAALAFHPNLKRLSVDQNALTTLDIRGTTLEELSVSSNYLTSLNTRNGHLTSLYASGNPDLQCIDVDDEAYAEANWRDNVDAGVVFSLSCDGSLNVVYIPDVNFKNALLANGAINTNADSEIQYSEAAAFTGRINVNSLRIEDLTGIEAFEALTDLRVHNNRLTELDVSSNPELRQLHCQQNSIGSLDIGNNRYLNKLRCFSNNLTSLNLTTGYFVRFQLFDAYDNDLTCISVDDVAWAEANLQDDVDEGVTFSTACESGARLGASVAAASQSTGDRGGAGALISVFPNPFNDRITIAINGDEEPLQAPLLYDIAGRKIDGVEVSVENRQTVLNMSRQPAGYYILVVNNQTYKVFKQ